MIYSACTYSAPERNHGLICTLDQFNGPEQSSLPSTSSTKCVLSPDDLYSLLVSVGNPNGC